MISTPIYVCVYDIIFYITDTRDIEKWWHVKQTFCRESGVPVSCANSERLDEVTCKWFVACRLWL